MLYEKSCGAVVYTIVADEIKYVLVSNLSGVYGFPKGHMEPGETEIETALREVFEETNLRINLVEGFKTTDEHAIPGKIDTVKHITYFLGNYENQEIEFQHEELSSAILAAYDDAMNLFKFESSRRILKEANDYLLRMQ